MRLLHIQTRPNLIGFARRIHIFNDGKLSCPASFTPFAMKVGDALAAILRRANLSSSVG